MRAQTLAHVSDLHLGLSPDRDRAAAAICLSLLEAKVDQVIVTGDVTHRGRKSELARFRQLFKPLSESGRLIVVPGNHDRLGEDAGRAFMDGRRVAVHQEEGLYVVRVDSTNPENRSLLASHGKVCERVLAEVDAALERAPAGALSVIALHHHVLPLPEESWGEKLASFFGFPNAQELALGDRLLKLAQGRCDLVLHGHRHVPKALQLWAHHGRHLGVYNAGSSTEQGQVRLFTHAHGALLEDPRWLSTEVAVRVTLPSPMLAGASVVLARKPVRRRDRAVAVS